MTAHLSHRNYSPVYKLRYAVRHPDRILPYARRIPPYARRWVRDVWLGMHTTDHIGYYRAVMRSDIARGPETAVGGRAATRAAWLGLGQMQFDYLLGHGLDPAMRMLEIGCGNLRAGRLFIDYLDAGNYHGIDISPEILLAALDTITEFGLQSKRPQLTIVEDLTFGFLPDAAFDVVHAHSVFSHSPIEVIDQCLRHVGRIISPGGFFDFTFHATERAEHDVLREDFYYRPATLISLAAGYGLQVRRLEDWERVGHAQSKLRVTRPVSGLAPAADRAIPSARAETHPASGAA